MTINESLKEKWQQIKRNVKAEASDFIRKQKKERRKKGGGDPDIDVDADVDSILSEEEITVYTIFPKKAI